MLLGPLILVLVVASLSSLLGGPAPNLDALLLLLPTFLFIVVFSGPLGEEVGRRGYALPRLQAGHSALLASLILGVIWAFWHLPLFFLETAGNSQIPVMAFLVLMLALTVLYTWIYNNTGGSILLVLVLHGTVNAAQNMILSQAIAADPRLFWLYVGMVCVVAIVMVALTEPARLSRKHHKQEEAMEEPVVAAPTSRVT